MPHFLCVNCSTHVCEPVNVTLCILMLCILETVQWAELYEADQCTALHIGDCSVG